MVKADIKPVTPTDYPAVLEVYRQCEDFLALGPVAKASMDVVHRDIREAQMEDGVFCGIFSGAKMIGVLSFVPSRFEFRPVDAFILLLMLASPYRKQGIGGDIVKSLEKQLCTHARIRSIVSWVQVNNPGAIRFWEKHGYQKFGGPELRSDLTKVYHLRKDIERGGKSRGKNEIQ